MREILFRGKRISNGEWVYGGIVTSPHPNYNHPMVYAICSNMMDIFVDQDSIGQYTGLTDKNGTKIFEGDIVAIPGSKMQGLPAEIRYNLNGATFEISRVGYSHITLWDTKEWCEVIGNIHDNPELLEVEDGN